MIYIPMVFCPVTVDPPATSITFHAHLPFIHFPPTFLVARTPFYSPLCRSVSLSTFFSFFAVMDVFPITVPTIILEWPTTSLSLPLPIRTQLRKLCIRPCTAPSEPRSNFALIDNESVFNLSFLKFF